MFKIRNQATDVQMISFDWLISIYMANSKV